MRSAETVALRKRTRTRVFIVNNLKSPITSTARSVALGCDRTLVLIDVEARLTAVGEESRHTNMRVYCSSPKTPQSPGSPSQPYFKFTDPALQCSALTIKERLLQWCRDKTRDYEVPLRTLLTTPHCVY